MKSKIKTDGKGYGKRLRLSHDEVDLILQRRADTLENINDNKALDIHLSNRGINSNEKIICASPVNRDNLQ